MAAPSYGGSSPNFQPVYGHAVPLPIRISAYSFVQGALGHHEL